MLQANIKCDNSDKIQRLLIGKLTDFDFRECTRDREFTRASGDHTLTQKPSNFEASFNGRNGWWRRTQSKQFLVYSLPTRCWPPASLSSTARVQKTPLQSRRRRSNGRTEARFATAPFDGSTKVHCGDPSARIRP